MLPLLGINPFFRARYFASSANPGNPRMNLPGFPVNTHRHTRRPAGGHAEAAAATASLKRAY